MRIIILGFLAFQCKMVNAQSNTIKLPAARHLFTVIAHRGSHIVAPENTLAAYAEAIKAEVDYVEIDLRTSKDSVLVIMHDATVDRMTNGKGKVSALNYAALRQLDIKGRAYDSANACKIPSFEEVLTACRDNIYIYLDFKDADVAQTYRLIRKYSMENQVIVYINADFQYLEWKRVAPEMPLMVSLPGIIKEPASLTDFITKSPVALLDGDYSKYTPAMLVAAAVAGVAVWPDIQDVNEAVNWPGAVATGFKGLQTDHPEALIAFLKSKRLR